MGAVLYGGLSSVLGYSLLNCVVSCRVVGGACFAMLMSAVSWFVPGVTVYVVLLNVTYWVW